MIDRNKTHDFSDALKILKSGKKKFLENIEVSINLIVLPKSKLFVIKGYSILPHGEPKKLNIAIFSTDSNKFYGTIDNCTFLTESDLINLHKKNLVFDLFVTTPSSMIKFSKLGKILNAKNLMPDVKYATVTTDISLTLNLLKKNYVRFRSDKCNVINSKIGNINLSEKFLLENLCVLISDIKKQKPKDCKNLDIKSLYLTSTMGSSFKIDVKSLQI